MRKLIIIIGLILVPTLASAQNVSTTQMQLITNQVFLNRIAYLMSQLAITVKAEALNTVCHTARTTLANSVITAPFDVARQSVILIAGSTNVVGTVITTANGFDSSVTDAALLAQISTLWNVLSKCDTGS